MDKNLEIIKDFVEGKSRIEVFERYCKEDAVFRRFLSKTQKEEILKYVDTANWRNVTDRMELYYYFVRHLKYLNVTFVPNEQYIKDAQNYFSVIPDWLPDSASDWVEENILNKVPEGMNKTQRKKWIKEQVEQLYPCLKRHPSWAQGTEDWPKDKDGNNLTFVKQKTDGDQETYTFVNPKTNEEVEVVEYY